MKARVSHVQVVAEMLKAAGESGTLAYCYNNILYEMPFVGHIKVDSASGIL